MKVMHKIDSASMYLVPVFQLVLQFAMFLKIYRFFIVPINVQLLCIPVCIFCAYSWRKVK